MIDSWWPMCDPSCLAAWLQTGDVVAVDCDPRILPAGFGYKVCVIRRHRVKTLDEFAQVAEVYRSIAENWSLPKYQIKCLFRGQTRDHFDHAGRVVTAPSAFRTEALMREYVSLEQSVGGLRVALGGGL